MHGRCGRAQSHWRESSPWRPGRSARRRSGAGICARARDTGSRRRARAHQAGRAQGGQFVVVHRQRFRVLPGVMPAKAGIHVSKPNRRTSSGRHRPQPSLRRAMLDGGSRRPGTKSLWLLPSGPDQVGDSAVRRLPSAAYGWKPVQRASSPPSLTVHSNGRTEDLQARRHDRCSLRISACHARADRVAFAPIKVTGHAWAPFISPMGEPFRAGRPATIPWRIGLRQADCNRDGVLTAAEMQADADRFFAKLDPITMARSIPTRLLITSMKSRRTSRSCHARSARRGPRSGD